MFWSEMRVHPSPEPAHAYRQDQGPGYRRGYDAAYGQGSDEGELFPYEMPWPTRLLSQYSICRPI